MQSGEMIDLATEAVIKNKGLLRRLLMDVDKHILYKLVNRRKLGHSEKNLKESMEAIGCRYPVDPKTIDSKTSI